MGSIHEDRIGNVQNNSLPALFPGNHYRKCKAKMTTILSYSWLATNSALPGRASELARVCAYVHATPHHACSLFPHSPHMSCPLSPASIAPHAKHPHTLGNIVPNPGLPVVSFPCLKKIQFLPQYKATTNPAPRKPGVGEKDLNLLFDCYSSFYSWRSI